MFFTRLGTILAWLALFFGALRVALGIVIASTAEGVGPVFSPRYLGSKSTGEAIDQGLMMVVFAVSLGIIVEISRSLRRAN